MRVCKFLRKPEYFDLLRKRYVLKNKKLECTCDLRNFERFFAGNCRIVDESNSESAKANSYTVLLSGPTGRSIETRVTRSKEQNHTTKILRGERTCWFRVISVHGKSEAIEIVRFIPFSIIIADRISCVVEG